MTSKNFNKQLQLLNAAPLQSSQNFQDKAMSTPSQFHSVAIPTGLPGEPKVTTKLQISAYKQKNAAIVQHQQDGIIQQRQMTQHEAIHVVHENHPDRTQFTEVHHGPIRMAAVTASRCLPVEQITHSYSTEQPQNALVPAQQVCQHKVSDPQPAANALVLATPQQQQDVSWQQVLVPSSTRQQPQKKLVVEYKHENVHVERKVLSEQFSKLPPRQPFQQIQHLESIPPVLPIQHPNKALVPITDITLISQQPLPGYAAATMEIRQQNQGINVLLETETISKVNKGEYVKHQTDAYQKEQSIREIRNVVRTPDGNYEHVQLVVESRILHRVFEQIYFEGKNEYENNETDDPISATDDDPKVDPSCFERCIDICCQACTCNFRNPFSHQTYNKKIIAKQDIMTPVLRRGSSKGMTFLKELSFPLFGPILRIVWIILELIFVLVSIIFSAVSFSTGSQEVFNILRLVLVSISTALVIFDGCHTLPTNCGKVWRKHHYKEQNDATETTEQSSSNCCNNSFCNFYEKYSDVLRTALSEVILFPLLLCNIFDFVTSFPDISPDNPESIVGVVLFGLGLVGMFLYVYFLRIIILSGSVYSLHKVRKENIHLDDYDPAVTRNALLFKLFFVVHVVGQMIVQLMMLVSVGINIYAKNQHFYEPDYFNTTGIVVSPGLWYMCVSAAYLPVFGVFTFFIVANFWAQQFPISFCIDMIMKLQNPKAGDTDGDEIMKLQNPKAGDTKMTKRCDRICKDRNEIEFIIKRFLRFGKLTCQFNELQNTAFRKKLAYPFSSPGIIFVCSVYFAAHFAFGYYAIMGITTANPNNSVTGTDRNSTIAAAIGLYPLFYIFMTSLLNIYAFAVPVYWIMVILIFIAGIILSSLANDNN